jgi:hypothetical protein
MRESFFEGSGKIGELGTGMQSQDGFTDAEDAVRGGFEGFRGGVIGKAGDDDLEWIVREECGSEAVRRSEEAVLGRDARKGFEGFLGQGAVAVVTGKSVHSNERNARDGIRAGRG